jgi:purine catabolism regulator
MAVRGVLALDVLAGSRVLAGEAGLDRPVTRVNVMEVPDVLPYVRPDELLVTTGYALRENPEQLGALVRELHRRGVAALGVKLGRYLDEMPQSAIEAGDELAFPVVALPGSSSYDELLTAVLTAVLDHQAQRLTRSEELHRALVQVVLGGGGLAEVAGALADILDVEVLLTDAEGTVVVHAPRPGSARPTTAGASDGADELPVTALPAPPFDGRGQLSVDALRRGRFRTGRSGGGCAVVPIVAGPQDHGRIVAVSAARPLGDVDLQALERAATVCALAITKQQAVTAVESKYQADFLRDVLLGRAGGPERTVSHASGLGWDLDRRLVVVVAEPDTAASSSEADDDAQQRLQLERLAAAWGSAVRRRDASAAVVGFTTEVVAVLAVPDPFDAERLARDLATSVAFESRVSFSVGVSRVADDAGALPTAYVEARRALAVGRQVQGTGAVASFDRLGVHRLLSLVPDAAELRSFERETLRDLADDTADAADLRHTLQVLLDTNLNVAQAARALHFHYNTLRYRIAKLERMLGPFTDDPLLRLDLSLALRVVQMRGIPR